jgi:hypothetical protein
LLLTAIFRASLQYITSTGACLKNYSSAAVGALCGVSFLQLYSVLEVASEKSKRICEVLLRLTEIETE